MIVEEWSKAMRKLILFLILGAVLGYLILEYLAQNQEQPQKRTPRPVGNVKEKVGAPAGSTHRQWQGTNEAVVTSSDDLTLINGIGPTFAKALNALGIHTFAQLAGQSAADIASRMSTRITAERIRRDRWIEQARELARSR
jgi:large subunit ribosomal protein L21